MTALRRRALSVATTSLLLFATLSLASGCDDERSDVDANKPPAIVQRQEARLVRVVEHVPQGAPNASGVQAYSDHEALWSADALAVAVYYSCVTTLHDEDGPNEDHANVRDLFRFETNESGQQMACPTPTTDSQYLPVNPTTCDGAICLAHAALCTAHRLADIAGETDDYSTARDDTGRYATVPPQLAVANAALLEVAERWAMLSGTTAGENLRRTLGRYATYPGGGDGMPADLRAAFAQDFPAVCDGVDLGERLEPAFPEPSGSSAAVTYGETLAVVFADATMTTREAAVAAAEKYGALADAEFSNTSSPYVAATRAWVDRTYSRSHGAHLLVGGSPRSGLQGFENFVDGTRHGYCPVETLDSNAKRALVTIRSTGVPMDGVEQGELTAAQFLDVVAARLATQLGRTEAQAKTYLTSGSSLTAVDYLRAARFVVAQNEAFARSREDLLPDGRVATVVRAPSSADHPVILALHRLRGADLRAPGSVATDGVSSLPFEEYGGVVGESGGSDGSYLVRQSLFDDRPRIFRNEDFDLIEANWPTTQPIRYTYAARGLTQYLDYAATVAYEITGSGARAYARENLEGGLRTAAEQAISLIGSQTAALNDAREGRAVYCSGNAIEPIADLDTEYTRAIYVFGADVTQRSSAVDAEQFDETAVTSDYRIVTGIDGVRCAASGELDGVPCDLEDYLVEITSTRLTSQVSPAMGFPVALEILFSSYGLTTTDLFVVRANRGTPAAGALIGPRDVPLRYSPVVDVMHQVYERHTEGNVHLATFCHFVPVVSSIDRIAATLVQPDTDRCSAPAVSCAGFGLDERIPLEEELSVDGNPYESSWQHYLDLAEQAAREADLLGEEVVSQGLAIEQRVEIASNNVQSICGRAVDIDWLAGLEPSPSVPTDPCTDGQRNTYDGIVHRCMNGGWVPDAIATISATAATDPNSTVLQRCLGNDQSVDFVSLGTSPVCVWTDDVTGDMCSGDIPSLDCPYSPDKKTGSCDIDPDNRNKLANAIGHPFTIRKIEENLGLFTNRVTELREDPSIALRNADAACTALINLREGNVSSRAEAEAAIETLRTSPFFSHDSMDLMAMRVGFRAMPYDHGAITIDGSRDWIDTGNPFIEGTDSQPPEWPCGVASPRCPITQPGTNPAGRSLACSAAPNCFASPIVNTTCSDNPTPFPWDFVKRVHMTQRLGRAELTLRLMTGNSLVNHLEPYSPSHTSGKELDQWQWVGGGTLSAFTTGLPLDRADLGSGNSVAFKDTTTRDHTLSANGSVYCSATEKFPLCEFWRWQHPRWMWTWQKSPFSADFFNGAHPNCTFDQDGFGGSECAPLHSMCPASGNSTGYSPMGDIISGPFMLREDSLTRAETPTHESRIWEGWGPASGSAPSTSDQSVDSTRYLVLRALRALVPAAPAFGILRGDTMLLRVNKDSDARNLSNYFAYCDTNPRAGTDLRFCNDSAMMSDGIRARDVLDAMELACNVARDAEGDACSPATLLAMKATGAADVSQLQQVFHCAANAIEKRGEQLVLRNVPREIIAEINENGASQTEAYLAGTRGADIAALQSGIVALRTHSDSIVSALQRLENAASSARIAIENSTAQRERTRIQMNEGIINAVAACTGAVGRMFVTIGGAKNGGVDGAPMIMGGAITEAVASCTSAAAQINAVIRTSNLEKEMNDNNLEEAFLRFSGDFQTQVEQLSRIQIELMEAQDTIDSALIRLQSQRDEAQLALQEAMLYGTTASGRHLRVNTILKRRFTTAQARYEQAHRSAIRLAYIAKLAIEQRIGFRLADMHEDLGLVSAPANWESRICTMTGIDFAKIRDDSNSQYASYEGEFIGDYVRNLRLTVEAYRSRFPFHDGADTAVISLRDNVHHSLDWCPWPGVETTNLLASSDSPAATLVLDELEGDEQRWEVPIGPCDGEVLADGSLSAPNCIAATAYGAASSGSAFGSYTPSPDLGGMTPRIVSAAVPGARISQTIPVSTGSFLVSAHVLVRQGLEEPGIGVSVGGGVSRVTWDRSESVDGSPVDCTIGATPSATGYWCRRWMRIDIDDPTTLRLELFGSASATVAAPSKFVVAGLMIEDVTAVVLGGLVGPNGVHPSRFVATTEGGHAAARTCEDTDGSVFRDNWHYACDRRCPDGFRTDCSDVDSDLYCFWETQFEITQRDLEANGRYERAGLAIGNFNQRVDSFAVNFVGTGILDCSDSPFPSTCNANGSVPYSIEHVGPYVVRNHLGEMYTANLFTASIEHARGLAAERYLTNPLSSADRSMVDQYSRTELRGRPLTGTYRLRVWDTGNVRFDRIEDLQILLGYRYWTQFH